MGIEHRPRPVLAPNLISTYPNRDGALTLLVLNRSASIAVFNVNYIPWLVGMEVGAYFMNMISS